MNKIIFLLFFLFCFAFYGSVNAATTNKISLYEEIYPGAGYKTVEEALNDFEQHFKRKLKLPPRVPPIAFTHYFGRFSDLDGDINDSFQVTFINDKLAENHYKMDVRPIQYKIPIRGEYVVKTFTLKSGNEAIYMTTSGFNLLVFELDDWQYMLGIDKRISDQITPEVLVDIANSIDY